MNGSLDDTIDLLLTCWVFGFEVLGEPDHFGVVGCGESGQGVASGGGWGGRRHVGSG